MPIATLLMFDGKAEEALNFYTGLFGDAHIGTIQRYGANDQGKPGSIMRASFTLAGQSFVVTDSAVKHDFTFSPAISLFLTCASEKEVETKFEDLSAGGHVLMPLASYPFARKFGWCTDRFGVSWQLAWN